MSVFVKLDSSIAAAPRDTVTDKATVTEAERWQPPHMLHKLPPRSPPVRVRMRKIAGTREQADFSRRILTKGFEIIFKS